MIDWFRGKYFFLSNFYESDVTFRGLVYPSAEAAFQAQKTTNPAIQQSFTRLKPTQAKALGHRIGLRRDWGRVKDAVMLEVVLAKFESNPYLISKLCETGTSQLIEGNTWGDHYWGVCHGTGENRLGYTLMQVRNWYQNKPVHYDRQLLRSLMYNL